MDWTDPPAPLVCAEQSGALKALEVDGFPLDGPLCFLNGVYARGTADFENYRPAWSKRDGSGDGWLFFHGADGWVFSDKPPSGLGHVLAAAVPVVDDGTIPIDDKSTSWRIKHGGEVWLTSSQRIYPALEFSDPHRCLIVVYT